MGIDKLNVAALRHPGDHSRRLFGAHPDGARATPIRAITRCSQAFKQLTGCPVIVNTSFNVRGEPIVCTPEDAYRCFMATEIDVLAIGNFILRKSEQRPRVAATAGAENPLFPAELLACLKPPGGEGELLGADRRSFPLSGNRRPVPDSPR